MEKMVLIDGYSILNRAFYGLPMLTNAMGEHTNGVYGFLNICLKILEEEQPQYVAVAFDVKAPTFRHKMYDAYKGTRKPMPTELTEQVPLLKELLQAMHIRCVEKAGFEADDIIGTLAKRCEENGVSAVIVSGDRDLLQLATDTTMVRLIKTKSGKTEVINYLAQDVVAEMGVTPQAFIDMKALMGDTSDNIPGLPGVGPKTAGAIIQKYGSIEQAWEHREEIMPNKARQAMQEHYDLAVLSKQLATIEVNAEISFALEEAQLGDIYTPEAYEIMKRHDFKSMFGRFEEGVKASVTKQKALPDMTYLQDFLAVEDCWEKATRTSTVGLALATWEGMLLGVALSFEGQRYYCPVEGFATDAYFRDKLNHLVEHTRVAVMASKKCFPFWEEQAQERWVTSGEDICLMAYLLNPLKSSYTYEELLTQYFQMTVPAYGEVFGKQSLTEASFLFPEKLGEYFSAEAWAAEQLWEKMSAELLEAGMKTLYETVEKPLSLSLYRMEQEGVRVDGTALKAYGKRLGDQLVRIEQEIYEQCGTTFNINSPKQLGEVLFEKMQLPGGKKTKSGYSTAADVLEKLAPDYQVVNQILEYRQLMKLKSTYAEGLFPYIREDGRIHGTFQQTVTATGRISSTEPNLQNIPVRMELGREIRKLFIPKEGCVLLDADYSQIELRVLAHMSGDAHLIDAYNTAADIHAITASQVFHVPLEEVTPQLRRNAKAVNFGIVYGISSFGLSEDLSISRKEAASYIDRYFEAYPAMQAFLKQLVQDAKTNGYSTTMFGRRRPIPELASSNFMQRSFGERVAMNAPIQGTAADIMKIAMIRVDERLRKEGFQARIILQVHDELLLEVPEREVEAVRELLLDCMTHAADLKVRLEVSAEVGRNWYETK